MKGTYDPDVVLFGFGRPPAYRKFEKACDDMGLAVREFKIYSIQVPMRKTKRYNEVMNFLRGFCLSGSLPDNIFINQALKMFEKQTNLKPFPKVDLKTDIKNPLLTCCLNFMFYQNYPDKMITDEEKKNFKMLTKLESKGFKRKGMELITDEPMPKKFKKELIKRDMMEG